MEYTCLPTYLKCEGKGTDIFLSFDLIELVFSFYCRKFLIRTDIELEKFLSSQ